MDQPSEKTAITETVTRLFHALDARDWETVQELFADRVDGSHGSHQMSVSDEEMTSDMQIISGYDATQYLLGPIVVEFDAEDRATARFHARLTHVLTNDTEESFYVVGGHYTVGLTRPSDTWKIRTLNFEEAYDTGDPNLLEPTQ